MSIESQIFESGKAKEIPDYDPEDVEYWASESQDVAEPYAELVNTFYNGVRYQQHELNLKIANLSNRNIRRIENNEFLDPETKDALKELNQAMSSIVNLVELQSIKGRDRNTAERLEYFSSLVQAQNDAIVALLRYGNEPVYEKNGRQLHCYDLVIGMAQMANASVYPKDKANQETDTTLSGIYAPVYIVETAREQGLRTILPDPAWDAEDKVDLILINERDNMAETLFCQVKGKTISEESYGSVGFYDNSNIRQAGLDDKGISDWNKIERKCLSAIEEGKKENPEDPNIDIYPFWCIVNDPANIKPTWSKLFDEGPRSFDIAKLGKFTGGEK